MRVVVACERSGIVRDAFLAKGADAWSVDIAGQTGGRHVAADVRDFLKMHAREFDLMIAHPPCQYLAASGWHRTHDDPSRLRLAERALDFFRWLLYQPIRHIAIENPVGIASTRIRPADQYIQPYQFGDDASKATGLWLKNLPPLRPTNFARPRVVESRGTDLFGDEIGTYRWANQTDSGQNREPQSDDRPIKRSMTYPGVARAMADQWTTIINTTPTAS